MVGGKDFGEDGFETVCKDFGDDFLRHITKADRSEVMHRKGTFLLSYKG